MQLVIQQPIFFPWCGYLELAKAADVFVHLDDVQLINKASFTNRVQIKNKSDVLWLTAPIDKSKGHLVKINESYFSDKTNWRNKHLKTIQQLYIKTFYYKEMMELTIDIYNQDTNNIAEFDIYCDNKLISFFGIKAKILKSSEILTHGSKSELVLSICKELGADTYITAHGALNYLDYNLFEKNNIEVKYVDYNFKPWNQQFGEWTPYVTSLDLIAAVGKNCIDHLNSKTVYWRDFISSKN